MGGLAELLGGHYWTVAIAAGALGAAGVFGAFRNLRRARLIEDTPTARIRSAPQGEVELAGRAAPGDKNLIAPFTLVPCVWYRATVHQRGDGGKRWKAIYDAASEAAFVVEDGSGECWVNPVGAEVRPQHEAVWTGSKPWPDIPPSWKSALGEYRYTERRVEVGDPLHVLGEFRSVRAESHFDVRRRLSELLAEWKDDRAGLLARFDSNRDGEVDLDEWERARNAAARTVAAEQERVAVMPAVNWIAKPRHSRYFLISSGDEAGVLRRLRWATVLWLAAAVTGLPVCAVLVLSAGP